MGRYGNGNSRLLQDLSSVSASKPGVANEVVLQWVLGVLGALDTVRQAGAEVAEQRRRRAQETALGLIVSRCGDCGGGSLHSGSGKAGSKSALGRRAGMGWSGWSGWWRDGWKDAESAQRMVRPLALSVEEACRACLHTAGNALGEMMSAHAEPMLPKRHGTTSTPR
ncbi:hypothetical protein BU16DRAFT_331674 [Lophium mytilinum]|uniref:Uncharacterized protein n=1 Tax=Lophium mytilinum TaxID=390894 RepID=A0A6A6R237_9PEZI|nr:hypothetical protein BU16DRAFT_331674 [Lophium mytilinum]